MLSCCTFCTIRVSTDSGIEIEMFVKTEPFVDQMCIVHCRTTTTARSTNVGKYFTDIVKF